jgi:hypothetical protein
MQPDDVRNLIRFNTHMGLFICPSTRLNVVSFIHGYEYGRSGECRSTDLLSAHIAKWHRIKLNALGWPHQIERLAERRSLDWMDVYLLVSSEFLSSTLESREAEA